jgi:hypothetical protein
VELLNDLVRLLPWAVWCIWWLWGVNWRKTWPMLAEGGWAPVVLLMIATALAWSAIDARSCDCLGFMVIPNGWRQLGTVCTLAALALFCGWLQGRFGWTPQEISVEPPPPTHDDHAAAHVHH